MVDPAVLAIGFGLMPLAALLLYPLRSWLMSHEDVAWGALVGAIAFLGLAHASTDILTTAPYVRIEASPYAAAGLLVLGVVSGLTAGHLLLNRRSTTPPALVGAVAIASLVYLAAHSVSDGLILGFAYAGPFPLGWPVDALDTSATLVHRFAEGALVALPALVLSWRAPKTLTFLLAGLATVPAVYLVIGLGVGTGAALAYASLTVFLSSFEAGLALLILGAGYLPILSNARDRLWPWAAGAAFLILFLVHLAVE